MILNLSAISLNLKPAKLCDISWRCSGDSKEWYPCTKLGRLVKDGMIKKIEEIYLFSLPIKEAEIIDFFLGSKLKDEVRYKILLF